MSVRSEVFGTFFFLAQHLTRIADVGLEPLGLTSRQWLLLAILVKRFPEHAPTLSEAAQCYGCSRQNVKQLALQLEERGFLEVVPDPEDKRALRLHLTKKVALFDAPVERERQEKILSQVFSGLDVQDLKQLRVLLRRWVESVQSL